MRRPSLLKNSSTGARNVESRTWQEHHITQLPTEQQNAWCRLSSNHWESLLYPRNVLFRNSWCSIGERQHPVVSLRVNCWIPGSYGQGSTRCCHRLHTLHRASNPRRLQSLRWLQTREVSPRLPDSTKPEILCMRCTIDLAETSIPVGYLRSSRGHWVLAASTSRSFHMAQFGDDTGSSCSHATLLMRTTNLVIFVDVSELSTDHPMEIPGTVPQTQTFQTQGCTTCPRVRTGQYQTIEMDTYTKPKILLMLRV